MECKICGKEYINLGVHLRHKHKLDPADYKEEFGILRVTALVDPELSAQLRAGQLRRLADPEYRLEKINVCRANAAKNVGWPSRGMSSAGKARLAQRNTDNNTAYLKTKAVEVCKIVADTKFISAVRHRTGMGTSAVKAIMKMGGITYSKAASLEQRLKNATASLHARRAVRVSEYKTHLGKASSAAEMCRIAGITKRTYKNWLAAGVIDRHPRTRNKIA